jgi:hypothetical protein
MLADTQKLGIGFECRSGKRLGLFETTVANLGHGGRNADREPARTCWDAVGAGVNRLNVIKNTANRP